MTTVKEIMSQPVEHTHQDESILHAAVRMREADVGALPVLDGDRLIGMITDRDIVVRSVAEGRIPGDTMVRDVLTPRVVFCFEDHDIDQATAIMEGAGVRRLPVLDENRTLVGMLSVDDLPARANAPASAGKVVEQSAGEGPSERTAQPPYDSGPKLKG